MCNQGQAYGHTQNYCNNNKFCRRCAAVGHDISQCKAEQSHCYHCGGDHDARNEECECQEREELLMTIQDEEKCHIMRARQILQKNNEFSESPRKAFTTHFDCEMTEVNKRKFTPWLLEKCITNIIGSKPKSIRSRSKTVFTIQGSNAEESTIMQLLSQINDIPIKTTVNTSLNICKGLICVYNYNLADYPEFRKDLMCQHGLVEVLEPQWKRSDRNKRCKTIACNFQRWTTTIYGHSRGKYDNKNIRI